ncbi:hypothetical protein GCM10007937_25150 [Mesorhizobium albiziae]|nr:hypothetical protein GCM10007937_25150 [Mesorhizobium albiziae]
MFPCLPEVAAPRKADSPSIMGFDHPHGIVTLQGKVEKPSAQLVRRHEFGARGRVDGQAEQNGEDSRIFWHCLAKAARARIYPLDHGICVAILGGEHAAHHR